MSVNETVGNAAKMREALEKVHRIACTAKNDFDVFAGIERIRRISGAALSAPPRNCDVGTARQQEARFVEACRPSLDCYVCKLGQGDCDCRFYWAQMPYEEGGAK